MQPIPSEESKAIRTVIVSYAFPPVGGAGVQRMLKLSKYLPAHGVTTTVLTVANPSVPVWDASLEGDVPADVKIVRARTWEPSYAVKKAAWNARAEEYQESPPRLAARLRRSLVALAKQALVPDPQLLWQPAAQRALAALLVRDTPDAVLISGPPFSQFLLAPLVRLLRSHTAVVLDYRDEWSTYRTTYEMAPVLASALGQALEPALLRCAHAVITATEAFRDHLLTEFSFLDPARVHAIPNGYDPDDIPRSLPHPPTDRFVLTYAGTIFRLTSARGLLNAIRRLHEREPELARLLEVRFFGRIVDTQLAPFEGMEAFGVRRFGYVEHTRVLEELAASHRVLCLLDDVPGAERIYPAKIFELMALGRPCFTIAPPGALVDLCAQHQLGEYVRAGDETAIIDLLTQKLREFRDGTLRIRTEATGIKRYDRRALAGEFATVLRSASRTAQQRA